MVAHPTEALARIQLFEGMEPDTLAVLAAGLQPVRLPRGEVLFREGDPGSALFLVASGEVRVMTGEGEVEVCRLGAGSHVGEMSLIDDAPRSATVVAACDSRLWRLDRELFESLADAHPQVRRKITAALVTRLRETTRGQRPEEGESVVLVADVRGLPRESDGLVEELARALAEVSGRRVAVRPVEAELAGEPVPPGTDRISLAQVDSLLESHGHVLLSCRGREGWAAPILRAAFGRADLVLLVTCIESESLERARAFLEAFAPAPGSAPPPVEVALDRRDELSRSPIDPVMGLAQDRPVHTLSCTPGYPTHGPPDFAGLGRVARRIACRRVGLVLGGGGARALAHIGVLEVLEEGGIPVDVLAGASGGAIVAGLAARDWSAVRIREFMLKNWTRTGVLDWGVPWVSVLRGRKVARMGRSAGAGLRLEELSRPCAVVAADLVTGEEVSLTRGDGWTAVQASMTVPGIFPPVRMGDRLLVDGGAVNTLPVDAARRLGADIVIGVTVTPPLEPEFLPSAGNGSRFSLSRLWHALRAGPPLTRIVYRTIAVQGLTLLTLRRAPDLTLKPDVARYDMFEFGDLRPIMAEGRSEAIAHLEALRALTRPPAAVS